MCTLPTCLRRLQENRYKIMSAERSSNDTSPLLQKTKVNPGHYFELIVRPCVAEFLGVCFFVFVGCMSLLDALTVDRSMAPYVPSAAAVAIAHGLGITALTMCFRAISGAHFNPAITLGVTIAGGISPVLAMGYFISQILGGICGAALCRTVLLDQAYEKIYGGAHILTRLDPGRAILCEIVITAILVLIFILVTVDETTKTKFSPLAIGFAATIGILASINATGGSMNPARSFGPALILSATSDVNAFVHHYVYWVGPIVGALVAAFFYRLIFANASRRMILRDV